MASKSTQPAKAENPEELLENVEQSLDRLRVMYEQYFLGIQKQAPGPLHTDVERKIRDLVQANLRNTALRYRFATVQQKFASYNAYWRRTVRQIENGTYARNLHKIGRQAVASGTDIPEEILAAMPKLMREQVKRDRAAAVARDARRSSGRDPGTQPAAPVEELLELGDAFLHEEAPMELPPEDLADVVALINEPSELRRKLRNARGPHVLTEDDGELDIDSFFAAVEAEGPASTMPPSRRPADDSVNFRAVTRATVPPHMGALPGQPPGQPGEPPSRPSQQMMAQPSPGQRPSQQMMAQPSPGQRPSQPMMAQPSPGQQPSQPMVAQPSPGQRPAQPMAAQPAPGQRPAPLVPAPPPSLAPSFAAPRPQPPPPGAPGHLPAVPPPIPPPSGGRPAPSQAVKPNPIAPGSAATARLPVPVPRQPMPVEPPPPAAAAAPQRPSTRAATPLPVAAAPSRPTPRPRATTEPDPPRERPPTRAAPPAGMTDADVNALYAKYVKAKEMVGEDAGPGAYGKLLKTINSQAPKIMEQYKAKGVDFQVVVKDNQVIIRAKPKP